MTQQITVKVEANDIDVAIERFCSGQPLDLSCPVQRGLQAHVERRAVVFTGSWHLAGQEKIPPTKGVLLPDVARDFIAAFDKWAIEVRRYIALGHSLEEAKAFVWEGARRPEPITFTAVVPA